MEASVLRTFRRIKRDELEVIEGDIVKILAEGENRHFAEKSGRRGYIPKSHVDVFPCPWFRNDIGRSQAKKLLLDQPDGSFVFRHSQAYPSRFALSVKYDRRTNHFLIDADQNGFYQINNLKFPSLNKIVEFYSRVSFLPDRYLNLVPITHIYQDID